MSCAYLLHHSLQDLATEALYINQNFRRQVLKRNEEGYKLTNPNMPFDDEIGDVECAYKLVNVIILTVCLDIESGLLELALMANQLN